ncbi:DUF2273 domain-containing protein [Furfurilactobacillus curtus]|uniref:DUF2273 domain-containing protein n=1 Tax=Furfurilactobacillus curtus TaxID=1746200 RepID=A0ABQ5JSW9_9LACO
MNRMMFGTLVGLILGLAWVLAGFWSMILVAVIAILGGLISHFWPVSTRQLKQEINRFLSD